jgi:hypothetical protein
VLDPAKLGVIDHIQMYSDGESERFEAEQEKHYEEELERRAAKKTKSRRTSYKNELTVRYGSKYRDPTNTELLMGKLQPMGKAFGIIAVCMFGPNPPSEKQRHSDRLLIWKSAAKYCMSDDTIQMILTMHEKDPHDVQVYLEGLLNTALVCVRTELPNSARNYAQTHVFAAVRRDAETQQHLGLEMNQSVMDQ